MLRLNAMNTSALCLWSAVGDLAVPKLATQECAALIMLAATLLVFRTFRERYLLIWILGWLAYFVSPWTLRSAPRFATPAYLVASSEGLFVMAVCLFAAAVFVYSHARRLIAPLVVISMAAIVYAVVRAIYWPDSVTLRVALEIAYRFIALTAAVQLIRFRWARGQLAPWLLGLSLMALHLEWAPVVMYLPPGSPLVAEMLFGTSILLLVLDDSKMRTRRLAVINALTTTITRAQQHGPMMATALEELKALLRARAAWFRLMEGENMVIAQQIGKETLLPSLQLGLEDPGANSTNCGEGYSCVYTNTISWQAPTRPFSGIFARAHRYRHRRKTGCHPQSRSPRHSGIRRRWRKHGFVPEGRAFPPRGDCPRAGKEIPDRHFDSRQPPAPLLFSGGN